MKKQIYIAIEVRNFYDSGRIVGASTDKNLLEKFLKDEGFTEFKYQTGSVRSVSNKGDICNIIVTDNIESKILST